MVTVHEFIDIFSVELKLINMVHRKLVENAAQVSDYTLMYILDYKL